MAVSYSLPCIWIERSKEKAIECAHRAHRCSSGANETMPFGVECRAESVEPYTKDACRSSQPHASICIGCDLTFLKKMQLSQRSRLSQIELGTIDIRFGALLKCTTSLWWQLSNRAGWMGDFFSLLCVRFERNAPIRYAHRTHTRNAHTHFKQFHNQCRKTMPNNEAMHTMCKLIIFMIHWASSSRIRLFSYMKYPKIPVYNGCAARISRLEGMRSEKKHDAQTQQIYPADAFGGIHLKCMPSHMPIAIMA